MNSNAHYYKWFQKVMSVFIDVFFIVAPLASLYVFSSPFTGMGRYAVFAAMLIVYGAVIFFLKDRIKDIISAILKRFERLDEKQMILIICGVMILFKVICTIFFNYDGTQEGDVAIYNELADKIIGKQEIHTAISHLYGVAMHYVIFKLLGLPLHVGAFFIIMIGMIFNFLSFRDIVGKERAFLLLMAYVVMPSTSMMSFAPTHEIFVYMYVSAFLYLFNRMIKEEKTAVSIVLVFLSAAATALTCLVNPGGYILYIIMVLCVLLSSCGWKKKTMVVATLILSILAGSLLNSHLGANEYRTTINTYTILIHGTNPESLGEQVDGYPLKQMRMYIHNNTLDFSHEGFIDAAKHVLVSQIIYLLSHPVILFRLIIHKIYILWSGVHYPLEYAGECGAYGLGMRNILLVINTLIYLFMVTVGLAYRRKDEDDGIVISNYKLELLGVIALTLLCIVVNKYSLYVTAFIYLISFYRADLK